MKKLLSVANSVSKKINKNFAVICAVSVMMMALSMVAFGDNTASGADALWTNITTLIETWVTRLGGVIIFIGGIMFGLGWKSDDAEQKSRGVSTIIAGAIVFALAELTTTFFA